MKEYENNLTVLSAIEAIVNAARYEKQSRYGYNDEYFRFNEELMEEVNDEAAYLASELAITPKQAVLFSLITEISQGEDMSRGDISEKFQTRYVKMMAFEEDLSALEKAWLIRKKTYGKICVSKEVQKCLQKDKPYRHPSVENMSTFLILSRISRLFQSVDEGLDRSLALDEMDGMLLANPDTSIAKTADKYGILKQNDIFDSSFDPEDSWIQDDYQKSMCRAERMLFYAMCYRYHNLNDDEYMWWNFKDYYDEDDLDELQEMYKSESLCLQTKVMAYVSVDGMLIKDRFKISDSVKEEILADCGGLHVSAPMAGLLKCDTLKEKQLYYDPNVEDRVRTLGDLLSEKRYGIVCKALEEKGLRTGFTCLFYGSPGTGKTETVYQLARKTGRDIVMAEVSKLKSCWVGESEKNLKELFALYKKTVKESKVTPILLFNEADAIFGKRKSGAENAVDKMENSLQNIILQEMEDLHGILIATTNLTENLDKAFERRFLYKIRFDNPSTAVKCKIWNSLLPDLALEDAKYLSENYDFSGGQIENIIRKSAIHAILCCEEPTREVLLIFCNEESIDNVPRRGPIGF